MRQSRAFLYGKSSGGDPLRESCVFYASFENWVSNELTLKKGDGTLTRTQDNSVSGKIGQGFDAGNDIANLIQGNNVLNSNTNLIQNDGAGNDVPLSFNFWANFQQDNSTQAILGNLDYGTSSTAVQNWFIGIINSALYFQIRGYVNGVKIETLIIPSRIILFDSWVNYTFTYNGDRSNPVLKGYINGVLQNEVSSGNYLGNDASTNLIELGGRTASIDKIPLNGQLDEVSIFKNRPLEQSDIDALYNNGNGIQLF